MYSLLGQVGHVPWAPFKRGRSVHKSSLLFNRCIIKLGSHQLDSEGVFDSTPVRRWGQHLSSFRNLQSLLACSQIRRECMYLFIYESVLICVNSNSFKWRNFPIFHRNVRTPLRAKNEESQVSKSFVNKDVFERFTQYVWT